MVVANLYCFAEGKYSGKSYEENIDIRQETFDLIKDKIENLGVYIFDLDGKHSEQKAEIGWNIRDEEEMLYGGCEGKEDGNIFYGALKELFTESGLDLDQEIKLVKEYEDTLDCFEDVVFSVKKSQVQKVKDFINALNIE